jgi:hypothetical protein
MNVKLYECKVFFVLKPYSLWGMKMSSTLLIFALKGEVWLSPYASYLGPAASVNVMFDISFCLTVSGFEIQSLGS